MPFKVKLFSGAPDYEALHVAKITDFPLEKRDYKPYSQVRVCFAEGGGLHLQFLSFESSPLPESCMKSVFELQSGAAPLELSLNAIGEFSVRHGGSTVEAVAHLFNGEDLQGVFWGGNLSVGAETLGALFPDFHAVAGVSFRGNLYKLCENPARPHYGCYYPADFSLPLADPKNLGDFLTIDY